jgi:hypothetical protein
MRVVRRVLWMVACLGSGDGGPEWGTKTRSPGKC